MTKHTRTRSIRTWLVAIATPVLLAGTAACGSDSTVDNSQEASNTAVPSVSSSESAAPESSSSEAPAPQQGNGNTVEDAQDSGAEQVDEVPSGTGRAPEDDEFLNELKDKQIDLSKVEGASNPGGVQDQIIAAGRNYCQAKEANQPDVFTALAAGQLQTQGVVDKDPKEIEKAITDAADSHFCS